MPEYIKTIIREFVKHNIKDVSEFRYLDPQEKRIVGNQQNLDEIRKVLGLK